nr:hypothetical protein [Tanacetum cinerariifolium]
MFGSTNKAWCDEFEVLMKGEFEMSAMGELTLFLGLQVKQLPDGIFISQDKYVKDMLKKFNMESVRITTTPYEVPKHKSKDDPDDAVNVYLFRSMIGSLMYLTASRPNIIFACKKQTVVATSSTEAEYVAAASCCGQTLISLPDCPHWDAQSLVSCGLLLYFVSNVSGYPKLQVVQALLLVVLIRADDLVPAGSCIIPTGSYSFMLMTWFMLILVHADEFIPTGRCTITTVSSSFILLNWFLLDDYNKVAYLEKGKGWEAYEQILDFFNRSHIRFIMDGMIGNIGSKRHKFLMYPCFLQMILGIQTTYPSPRPTFYFTAKLFSNMKLNWDGPHMPLLASMLVVPTGGDGADAVTAGAAAAHDVSPPPIVPPTHSTPGPSSASQVTPVKEPTPVRDPTPVKDPTLVRDPTPVREPTPSLVRDPTPDSPRPPSPPPKTEEVGPTTSTRPPSLTRHTSVHEDISEGGGDFFSSPQSNEALQTLAATAAGGAEDSAALTALFLKLDRCLHRVTTLENELGITKNVLGGSVLKLVTRVKRLEGLLQQRKQRLVLSDSEGEDATQAEQDIDLAALHTLASASLGGDSSAPAAGPDADTTMPFRSTSTTRRRLRKPFTSFASAHVSKNIPAGASVPDVATTIPAGSSVDAVVHVAAAPSSSIPTAADKGKAPMVDDSLPADLLSEQERVLKNLHDSQLGEELAKKIHAEQEAEFTRQQEELAQKAQAERVASPTEHGPGMFDQCRRELDAAQLIYTEADWLELLAKIATNSAISKQLLGDDVTEENMNERLGMLLLRAPQVPAASSQVPAGVPAAPSFLADVSIHASTSSVPADISVPTVSLAHAAVSVPAETMVHTVESHLDDPLTASENVSTKPTVAAPTPSSSRQHRKHIAKKRVTPIVDMVDAAMIKFDTDSDDDPLPYAPYASWEMVPSPLGSIHAYHAMARHTKHFTTLRKLLHMVEKTDLQKLLGAVDELYQKEESETFALLIWRLYPRAQVHVLETVDGWVIHMFVDVYYPLTVATLKRLLKHGLEVPKLLVGGDLTMAEQLVATLERLLKHGLEVPKLLVGGDLTMAEQLVGFIKAAILNAKSAV